MGPLTGLAQEQEVARLRVRPALEVLEHEPPAPAPAAGQVRGPGPLRDLGPQLGRLDQRKVGHGIASHRAATMGPPGLPSSVADSTPTTKALLVRRTGPVGNDLGRRSL